MAPQTALEPRQRFRGSAFVTQMDGDIRESLAVASAIGLDTRTFKTKLQRLYVPILQRQRHPQLTERDRFLDTNVQRASQVRLGEIRTTPEPRTADPGKGLEIVGADCQRPLEQCD